MAVERRRRFIRPYYQEKSVRVDIDWLDAGFLSAMNCAAILQAHQIVGEREQHDTHDDQETDLVTNHLRPFG